MTQQAGINIVPHQRRCARHIGFLLALLFTFSLNRAALPQTPDVLQLTPSAAGAEIQKALDSLQKGGEVDLAAGTYELHQPLVLRHNHLALRGSGLTTILHLADKANCPVVVLGAPGNPALCAIDHVQLADLLIDGNRRNQQVESWHSAADGALLNNNGVDIWRAADAEVSHVTCCHCRSGGMVTSSGTRRLTVDDFTAFDNQFDGLACYLTEDSHFSHLHLHDNLSAGISLDLEFNHNTIDDAEMANNDLGIFMRASRDNSFQRLKIIQ